MEVNRLDAERVAWKDGCSLQPAAAYLRAAAPLSHPYHSPKLEAWHDQHVCFNPAPSCADAQ